MYTEAQFAVLYSNVPLYSTQQFSLSATLDHQTKSSLADRQTVKKELFAKKAYLFNCGVLRTMPQYKHNLSKCQGKLGSSVLKSQNFVLFVFFSLRHLFSSHCTEKKQVVKSASFAIVQHHITMWPKLLSSSLFQLPFFIVPM